MARTSLRAKTASGFRWQSLEAFGVRLIAFAASLALARMLAPDDFGLVALLATICGYLMIVAELGLSTAIIQRKTLDDAHLSAVFYWNLAAGLALTGVCIALSGPLASFYKKPGLQAMLQVFSPYFVIAAASHVPRAVLFRRMEFRKWALVSLLAQVVFVAVAVPLAAKGLEVWSLVWGGLAQTACITVGVWVACRWRPVGGVSVRAFGDLLGFSSGIALANLAGRISRGVDVLIAGRTVAAATLGLYSFSLRLTSVASQQFTSMVANVMFPAFSRIQGHRPVVASVYLRASSYLALVNVPIAVMMFFGATPFVAGVLGPKWSDADVLIRILSLYALAGGLGGALWGAVLKSQGHSYLMLALNLVRTAALAAFVGVGSAWGILGIATAVAVYGVIFRFVYQAVVNRKMSIRMLDYLQAIAPALMCGTMAFGATAGVLLATAGLHPLIQLPCIFVAVCGGFAAAVRVVFPDLFRRFLDDLGAVIRSGPKTPERT